MTKFIDSIRAMNEMYKLPSYTPEEQKLSNVLFSETLFDEIAEANDFDFNKPKERYLVDVADWLGDIIVYCSSESHKHGNVLFEDYVKLNFAPSRAKTIQQVKSVTRAVQRKLLSLLPDMTFEVTSDFAYNVNEDDVRDTYSFATMTMFEISMICIEAAGLLHIPLDKVIEIIMASNESKLGADGKPIYDDNGKFLKGPNYWKPEPKIEELLVKEGLIPA